jgi:putative addiction module component (TIGR02574 family)
MARVLSDIESEVRQLARGDQERLLCALLAELDGPPDLDAERIWLDEVQRRSAEFDSGLVKAIPAEEVFARIRSRSK